MHGAWGNTKVNFYYLQIEDKLRPIMEETSDYYPLRLVRKVSVSSSYLTSRRGQQIAQLDLVIPSHIIVRPIPGCKGSENPFSHQNDRCMEGGEGGARPHNSLSYDQTP
jgi:hypothetical protein